MTTAMLRFSGGLDATDWEARYNAGDVPSRWPYGLDQLAEFGLVPMVERVVRRDSFSARALRKVSGFDFPELLGRPPSAVGDMLLCWDERSSVPALFLGRPDQRPVSTGVIWLTENFGGRRNYWIAKQALTRAHKIWTLSTAQLPILIREFGLSRNRLAHLPFGVDAEFFTPADVGHEADYQLVVSAGNDRHRDFRTLLAAVRGLRRQVRPVRLELATRIRVDVPPEMGSSGELSHRALRDLYRRSAVVAIATKPNVHVSGITAILEAMACGKAVIASHTEGMQDYVSHNVNGVLVPPGNPDALAEAIGDLLRDPARAQALGAAGRQSVEAIFNTREQARRLADIVS